MPKPTSEMLSPQPVLKGGDDRSRSLSLVTVKDERQQTEELHRLLGVLPDDETEDAGEETEKMKTPLERQSNLQERLRKTRRDILSIQDEITQLEVDGYNMMTMKVTIEKEEQKHKHLEEDHEFNRKYVEDIIENNKKKSADARTLLEKATKFKQEKMSVLQRSADQVESMRSELAKVEGNLNQYKLFEDIMLERSPVEEEQEIQKTKALKAPVPSEGGLETEESSPGRATPSTSAPSSPSGTLEANSTAESDRPEHEDKPGLCISDPQELLDVMYMLTDQNLSLIQNSRRVDDTLEELTCVIKTTRLSMEEAEEEVKAQLCDMKHRINQANDRTARLQQMVELHNTLKTTDEDIMLDSLGKKVSEVYCCCIDKRLIAFNVLEKLIWVENHMIIQLEQIEIIPEEFVEKHRQIQEQERRIRQQEEKHRLEMQKQEQKQEKCKQRSLGRHKKMVGRRLMPKSFQVVTKREVIEEDDISDETELPAYLYGTDDL